MRSSLLIVLLFAAVSFGADAPPVKSPAAVQAIAKSDAAIKKAEDAYRAAKLMALKQLVTDLKVAMGTATKSGNLDEANAIKAAMERGHQNDGVEKSLCGTQWQLDKNGTIITYAPTGRTVQAVGWDSKRIWKVIGENEVVQGDQNVEYVTVTFSSDMQHGLWVGSNGAANVIYRQK